MPTVTVNVTRRDVEDGDCCSTDACPVALAIARAVPGSTPLVESYENPHFAVRLHAGGSKPCRLPAAVGEIIRRYDNEGVMEPFSFEFEY